MITMKYFRKIIGEKVYLSPMCIEDADTYCTWLNDEYVSGRIGLYGRVNSTSTEKEYIERIHKERTHYYSIVLKENDKLIGNIGIEDIDDISRTANIGIFIGEEENRHKGYGSDACKYAFDTLNLHSLHLWVFSFNETAISVYKKVGFKEAGCLRESYYFNGKYHNHILMDLLKDELK